MLPMAEYAYNNSLQAMVKMTQCFANYGYHPRTNWPTAEPLCNPNSQNYIQWMTSVNQLCCQGLEKASETMRKYYDKKSKPAQAYEPGDVVMLNGKNLKTRRPARKLDAKLHGTFKVIKVMSPTELKLESLSQWRIWNAVHESLIGPFPIANDLIQDPPDLDAIVTAKPEFGYDVEGYEYQTGYEV